MKRNSVTKLAGACVLALAGTATAQAATRVVSTGELFDTPRYTQPAGASDGHCVLRVWVDDRATVVMRGDNIAIRTESGRPANDSGSTCSAPLPERVGSFRVQVSNQLNHNVNFVSPSPSNDSTGYITVDDPQNGGRLYVMDVFWDNGRRAPPPDIVVRTEIPDALNCQERVRDEVLARNGSDVAVDFNSRALRTDVGFGRERIRGSGTATGRYDTSSFSYECLANDRRILSASYQVRERGEIR